MDNHNPSIEKHKFEIQQIKVEDLKSENYPHSLKVVQTDSYSHETVKIEKTLLNWDISKFECDSCDSIFTDKSSLEHHIKERHTNDLNEGEKEGRDENIHTSGQTIEKPWKCFQAGCKSSFKSKWLLCRHRRKVHNKERPFRCKHDGCTKSYKFQYELDNHMDVHRVGTEHMNAKRFKCQYLECTKSFKSKSNLNLHMLVHSEDRKFKCQQTECGKSFKRKGDLENHMIAHSGRKPFKCEESGCTKCFKSKWEWNQHKRVHTNLRPFRCEGRGCLKKFRTKANMQRHMRLLHNNEQSFKFEHTDCIESYKREDELFELEGEQSTVRILSKCEEMSCNVRNEFQENGA